jgi:ribosomal protein S12 methylthiotransferase accessory factor
MNSMDTQELAELLRIAASILAGDAPNEGPAGDLLASLRYLDGAPDAAPHRSALLRAASGFQRIFSIPAEDAPGLVALGAEVDAACVGVPDPPTGGVSGTGLSFRQAFESCVGEGIEYIAQFATPTDRFISLTDAEALRDATPALQALWERLRPFRRNPDAERTDWTWAANLADGMPVLLPADLCFRRPAECRDLDPPWPLSTGCGAGADPLGATLHGLLELIERDAMALWLRAGMRPRLVPPGPGAALLGQLRGESVKRRTWLLDITSDVGVPVVVAVACDTNGFGLCRGSACRSTLAAAAEAALMELTQMELAYRISATKRATRGDAALNRTDRRHICRYTTVDAATTEALHPLAPPRPPRDLFIDDKIVILAHVRQRLAAIGQEVYALNLTRPSLGISVSRLVAPGLEMGLESPPGPRLRVAADRAGVDLGRTILL